MSKVAVVIGHQESSQGARNVVNGMTEYHFNEKLAKSVCSELHGVMETELVYRTTTYSDLPGQINALNPDLVVSLHCNAYNTQASGSEVLYYHTSSNSERMAQITVDNVVDALQLPNRGIKPKTSEDRGGYLLRYTNAPAVIVESFFIDNSTDLAIGMEHVQSLATSIARSIITYFS